MTYASAGSLLDISALSEPIRLACYYPRAYQVFQADGKQYGLPESFSDVAPLLQQGPLRRGRRGVSDAPTGRGQDELAAAQKLTDKAEGRLGRLQPVQFWEFYKVLAQSGGQFFNADKTQATFNDAKGVEAANWLIDKPPSTR